MRQILVEDLVANKKWTTTSAEFKKRYNCGNVSDYIKKANCFKGRYLIKYTGKVWHKGVLCEECVLDVLNYLKNNGISLNAYKSFNKSYKEEFEEKMIDADVTLHSIMEFYKTYNIEDMM